MQSAKPSARASRERVRGKAEAAPSSKWEQQGQDAMEDVRSEGEGRGLSHSGQRAADRKP